MRNSSVKKIISTGLTIALTIFLVSPAMPMGLDFGFGPEPEPAVNATPIAYYLLNNSSPARIATGSDGKVYVTDPLTRQVYIFSNNGVLLSSFGGFSAPLGIAVGRFALYVSDAGSGSVGLYTSAGELITRVGTGFGEFSLPNDIAVYDSIHGGRVYVTDSGDDLVKVYATAGAFLFSFGSAELNYPTGIAVDAAESQVYVIDHNNYSIRIYDLDGNLQGTIDGAGALSKPLGIAFDSTRLYITDAFHSAVAVFDKVSGAFLAYIGNYGTNLGEFKTPTDAAFDSDGKLFVTNTNNQRIEVFGIDDFLDLQIDPEQLDFSLLITGSPVTQTVDVTSTGNTIQWDAVPGTITGWMSLSSQTGTTPSTVGVTVDPSGLSGGADTAFVSLASPSGTESVLKVNVLVEDPTYVLTVTPLPSPMHFVHKKNAAEAPTGTLSITSTPYDGLAWGAASTVGWMHVDPAGVTPASAGVSFLTSGPGSINDLPAGTYDGEVVVTADAQGSPERVAVTLEIALEGSIEVRTNVEGAGFEVIGPDGYSYSGTESGWRDEQAPEGNYTVTYLPVTGYGTPAAESQYLGSGQEIIFEGRYHPIENIVVTQGSSARWMDEDDWEDRWDRRQTIRIYSSGGALLGAFPVFEGYASGLDTVVGDIDGDGLKEIIAGLLSYSHIRVYDEEGVELARLQAFENENGGVQLAVADFNGDGDDELVVMSLNDSAVKLYDYDPGSGGLVETSIHFMAYEGLEGSQYIGAGDVDGDAETEMVSLMNVNWSAPVLKVWNIVPGDTPGGWTAGIEAEAVLGFNGIKALEVTDRDGDGAAEILMASGRKVVVVDTAGNITETVLTWLWSVEDMAIGDVNGDGLKEVVIGQNSTGKVLVYDEGIQTGNFRTFGRVPVMVSTGTVGPVPLLTNNSSSGDTSVSSFSSSDEVDDDDDDEEEEDDD